LDSNDARALRDAYCFLRDVEHRLQMEENLQTHTIPAGKPAQERLARLMGSANLREFESVRRTHTEKVRSIFDALFKSEKAPANSCGNPAVDAGAEEQWKQLLA